MPEYIHMPEIELSDIAFLVTPLLAGIGSGRLLTPKVFRQCGLRPNLQPPGWAFGVAWVVLYILAGAACCIAWRRSGRCWTRGLILTIVALSVLMVWWVVFANWCNPPVAFATLVPSSGLVVAAAALLWTDKFRTSSLLLVPLIMWLLFAGMLSYNTIV